MCSALKFVFACVRITASTLFDFTPSRPSHRIPWSLCQATAGTTAQENFGPIGLRVMPNTEPWHHHTEPFAPRILRWQQSRRRWLKSNGS